MRWERRKRSATVSGEASGIQHSSTDTLTTTDVQTIKIWDILAPYITNPEPTWSNQLRLSSPISAALWTLFELSLLFSISLLRIPQLTPSSSQFLQLFFLLVAWNLACWIVSEPGSFWVHVNFLGPPSLGREWYLAWWYLLKKVVWKESPHLGGVHHIRLLPFR
jgi:nucleoporin POM152